jgi:hypothetical protein
MATRSTSTAPRGARRRAPSAGLLLVVALLGSALATPPTASAVRSEFYGIAQGSTLDRQDINGMANARVRTDRFLLNWGLVQPASSNAFDWTRTDEFIGALASRGVRSVPAVWGSPPWMVKNPAVPPLATPSRRQAWIRFVKAAVARYGAGGTYWTHGYRQLYGAGAKPLPVQAWQVWNEPNLSKFFAPSPSPTNYARLVHISHDPIKTEDPQARVVLAGLPGDAWDFLDGVYSFSGIKRDFDVVALHPYGPDVSTVRLRIRKARDVMTKHGDQAKPLWITEFAWGSAPPDRFGLNQGPTGQATMLKRSFRQFLEHRTDWKLQRVFWYHWRDPRDPIASCSFCGSAGLLKYNRTAKPAMAAFKSFATETIAPTATITSGPSGGAMINDATPTFTFTSSEAGSTFVCSINTGPFKDCKSPYTLPRLADGPKKFSVRAIDAPGNVSATESRSFTIDTSPPAIPTITGTNPSSPANNNAPKVIGTSGATTTIQIYKTTACTGSPVARGTASRFKSPGISVSVPDNSTTVFRARAADGAGNTSGCSAEVTYVEDSAP